MKTLFLKSNLPHIRLKAGEYEVSNPEVANQFTIDDGNGFIFRLKSIEWPYGVELVDACPDKGNLLVCANESCWDLEECQHKKVARLLPKEEKPVSAPSESQEDDLWEELSEIINSEPEERITGNTLAALSTKFTITRKTRIAMENITVENANEMLAKAKISDTTYRKQAAAWVIVNQFCYQSGLYNNRDDDHLSGIQKVIKYLSENKSLHEKLKIAEHLKELDDDAIVTLQREKDNKMSEVAALKALITVTLHKQGFKNEEDIVKAMAIINCGDFSEIEDVFERNRIISIWLVDSQDMAKRLTSENKSLRDEIERLKAT